MYNGPYSNANLNDPYLARVNYSDTAVDTACYLACTVSIWEFPKIGDPNMVP